jgi:hypothetical protein
MSYFEYNYTGELTETFEQKTKELVDLVSLGFVPFFVVKYWDDTIEGTEKKKRTIILSSQINLINYFQINFFKDCVLERAVYFKQLIA